MLWKCSKNMVTLSKGDSMSREILNEISAFMQKGRAKNVKELVQQALDEGIPAKEILDDALLAAMGIVGAKFKNNEVFVPEVLITARAMSAGVEILKPHLAEVEEEKVGTVILGTVKGDLHDIGKNLVKIMMEGKGITVIDIGVDVPAEVFIEKAIEHKASIIAASALLTTTMGEFKNIVAARKANTELDPRVKVMIGGAPVTQEYCDEIGADLYTADAASAAETAFANMIKDL